MKQIPQQRLVSQQLVRGTSISPAEAVAKLGAVQAQDYGNALWAVGCRIQGATAAGIEEAIAARTIVRTWPMRGTLHFVPAADIRWMLALLTPRILTGTATRLRQLELDEATLAKAERTLRKELQDGTPLSRDAIFQTLERAKISTEGGRGYHILFRMSLQQVLCQGPRLGKQQSFVLMDHWVPETVSFGRDESLGMLARRFFGGHGPATIQDFVWWAGLTQADAKAAVAQVAGELVSQRIGETEYWCSRAAQEAPVTAGVHLLPGFDEYLLGYKNRHAVLEPEHAAKVVPGGNGIFLPMMLKDGHVIGTWKRAVGKGKVTVTLLPFAPLTSKTTKLFAAEAERYGLFLGLRGTLAIAA